MFILFILFLLTFLLQRLLDRAAVVVLLKKDAVSKVAAPAREAIGIFLREYPQDRDAQVFAGVYAKLNA